MPHRNLITIFLAAIVSFACYHTAQRNRYASTIGSAMSIIEERALEPSTRRDLFYSAMDGMMGSLDEHSMFIDPERLPALEEHLDQEFGGVGFVVERDPETNQMMVLSPIVGTPAYKAGVTAGDVILAIDGKSTEGLDVNETVNRIRGPRGTQVRLTLQSALMEEQREVDLVRELIAIESIIGDRREPDGSWVYSLEDFPEIAYVRLTEFGEKTAGELKRVAGEFDPGMRGLILDLRDNSGGLLDCAVDICDMFISEGTIVTIKSRGGKLDARPYVASTGTVFPKSLPIAVLINENTASASEILSACLQDHQRVTVVGQKSYGKGTVQQIIKIDGGRSALKLTVSSYWRPSGRNIHRLREQTDDNWGVSPIPGYEVVLTDDQARRWFLWRRQRDYPATKLNEELLRRLMEQNAAGTEATEGNPETSSSSDVPAADGHPDPQLQKAIEAILKTPTESVAIG